MSISFLEIIGWLVVHSLWQWLLVGLLSWLLTDLCMRSGRASTRYVMLCIALAIIVACPVVTACLVAQPQGIAALSDLTSEAENEDPIAAKAGSPPFPRAIAPVATTPSLKQPASNSSTAALSQLSAAHARSVAERFKTAIDPWLSSIAVYWSIGVCLLASRLLFGWYRVETVRRGAKPLNDARLLVPLRQAARKLNVQRSVSLLICDAIDSPAVVGVFKSFVLIPASFLSHVQADHIEAILAHELAHVRRYDYLINLLQALVETLFFYHPVVWWISHRIRVERESCCDDLAAATVASPKAYSQALLALEELRGNSLSPALGIKDRSLHSRVRRLLGQPSRHDTGVTNGALAVSIVASLAAGLLVGVASLRADETDEDEATDSKFIATVSDDLSVELIAIMPHNGTAEQAWRPNGSPFTETPALPPVPGNSATRKLSGIDLFLRYRGLSDRQGPTYEMDGVKAMWNPNEDGVASIIVVPDEEAEKETLMIGIPDPDFGPWKKVDLSGNSIEPVKLQPRFMESYETIRPVDVRSRGEGSLLCWAHDRSDNRLARIEVVAVDQSGERHERYGSTLWDDEQDVARDAEVFDLSMDDIDHIEYRLQPIRHWVTVKNLALKPNQTTRVLIDAQAVAIPVTSDTTLRSSMVPPVDGDAQQLGEAVHRRLTTVDHLSSFQVHTQSFTSYYGEAEGVIGLQDERSLANLKLALDEREFDRSLSTADQTWAWKDKVVVSTWRQKYVYEGKPYDQTVARTWNGSQGWFRDSGENFGRYVSFEKIFAHHYFRPSQYFYLGDHHFAWAAREEYPPLFLNSTIPVERANYQSLPDEVFAGEPCRVIRSIPREEQFWVSKQSGDLRGCLTFLSQGRFTPMHEMEATREMAGRSFDSREEFRQWLNGIASPEQRAQLRVEWSFLHRHNQHPDDLIEFSDYREVIPGIRIPMSEWHSTSSHAGEPHEYGTKWKYHVHQTTVKEAKTDIDVGPLVAESLPKKGNTINDWRFSTHVKYDFDPSMPESEVHALVDEAMRKRAANQKMLDRILKPLTDMKGKMAPKLSGLPMPGETLPRTNHDKPTLLHFWAGWCGPCKNDIPLLNRMSKNGWNVIGVHAPGTDVEAIEAAAKDEGIEYPVVLGAGDSGIGIQPDTIAGYPVAMFPCCVLIDKDGNVEAAGSLKKVIEQRR